MFVRFSTVIGGRNSPETARDPRGFAVKFYTEDGNWDLVGNNLRIFFIRDAIKFPDMVHAFKPDPVTNQEEAWRFYDFVQFRPEALPPLPGKPAPGERPGGATRGHSAKPKAAE